MVFKHWLEMLEQATSYRDLQHIFSQMVAEVNSASDASVLAESIDEAIRRIEQERARDNSQLESFTNEYEAFKSQQSGMVGWFKRKLPFTETRKQELQHRGAVSDQYAEILADNFVIARAQMLKERILASPSRRMGLQPNEWRDNLVRHATRQDIRDYGNSVSELNRELSSARSFVDSVRGEVEAFSEASFTDKRDRTQRDAEVRLAQREVKWLDNEIREKESLRNSALKELADLIHDELMTNDTSFQSLVSRAGQLKAATNHFANTAKVVDELHGHLATMCGVLTEFEAIPTQKDSLERKMRALQAEFERAESRRSRAADALNEPSRLFESATLEVSNATSALAAAKRMYDAYLAEQSKSHQDNAEVTSDFDFDETSPVIAEYGRLKTVLSQAEDNAQRFKPSYDNAKRALDQVTQELDSIQKKADAANKELLALDDKESQLSKQIIRVREQLFQFKDSVQAALQNHANQLQEISWLENFRSIVGIPSELSHDSPCQDIFPASMSRSWPMPASAKSQELVEFQNQLDLISRLAKTLQSDRAIVDKNLANLVLARKDALQRRCQTLLESSLANEVKFE